MHSCSQNWPILMPEEPFFNVIVLHVSPWFFATLHGIMIYYRTAKHRYEIVIGENGLAVLKTGRLLSQSGRWTYRLLGHNRYEPSGACRGRECGEKWRILRIRWITERKDNLCNISVFNTALHRKIHNAANNHDISYLWRAAIIFDEKREPVIRLFFIYGISPIVWAFFV